MIWILLVLGCTRLYRERTPEPWFWKQGSKQAFYSTGHSRRRQLAQPFLRWLREALSLIARDIQGLGCEMRDGRPRRKKTGQPQFPPRKRTNGIWRSGEIAGTPQ